MQIAKGKNGSQDMISTVNSAISYYVTMNKSYNYSEI